MSTNAKRPHKPVKMPPRDCLVAVRWLDSYVSVGWSDKDTKPQCAEVFSVGWLVSKTKQAIQLAQSVSATPGCGRCGLMSIPRGCVLQVDILE